MRQLLSDLLSFIVWAWTSPFYEVWPFVESGLYIVGAYYAIKIMRRGKKK